MTTALGLVVLALAVGIYGSIIGAGGGFLMVAGLVVFFDLNGATAVGTSVVTTLFIQSTSAWTYGRRGLVDRPTALWFVFGSVPIAFASASLADDIPQGSFDLGVGVLLILLAVFVLFAPSTNSAGGETVDPKRLQLFAAGSAIGVMSGALGVGAGLVTVPLLGWMQRLPVHRAVATTTVIGATSGLAATIGHTIANNPRWGHLPYLIGGAMLGGRIGSTNAGRLSPVAVVGLLASGLVAAGVPLVLRAV